MCAQIPSRALALSGRGCRALGSSDPHVGGGGACVAVRRLLPVDRSVPVYELKYGDPRCAALSRKRRGGHVSLARRRFLGGSPGDGARARAAALVLVSSTAPISVPRGKFGAIAAVGAAAGAAPSTEARTCTSIICAWACCRIGGTCTKGGDKSCKPAAVGAGGVPPNNDVTGEVPGKPSIPPTASAPGPPKPRAPLNRAFERMIRISSRCALSRTWTIAGPLSFMSMKRASMCHCQLLGSAPSRTVTDESTWECLVLPTAERVFILACRQMLRLPEMGCLCDEKPGPEKGGGKGGATGSMIRSRRTQPWRRRSWHRRPPRCARAT